MLLPEVAVLDLQFWTSSQLADSSMWSLVCNEAKSSGLNGFHLGWMSGRNSSFLCWVVCVKTFFTCLVLYYPGFSLEKCTFHLLHSCVCRGTTSNCPAKNCFLQYWIVSRACASAWTTDLVEEVCPY